MKLRKKLIEVAMPSGRHQCGVSFGEVDLLAWASKFAAHVVGATSTRRQLGRDLCADGGRPIGAAKTSPRLSRTRRGSGCSESSNDW